MHVSAIGSPVALVDGHNRPVTTPFAVADYQ